MKCRHGFLENSRCFLLYANAMISKWNEKPQIMTCLCLLTCSIDSLSFYILYILDFENLPLLHENFGMTQNMKIQNKVRTVHSISKQ